METLQYLMQLTSSSVENGRVLLYCAGEKGNKHLRDHWKYKSKTSSSSGTEYGETSEYLHSGEWWARPEPFTNSISGFIVL
jgi:hypothetical protein